MNELSTETSPYLLQHANNPIHWKAWNPKSLAAAVENNKLIIISIGYSACHWCHVMEHETFEDIQAAETMNAHFVSIKIDREERPDVDAVYMKAVQLMTRHGGWPLNVVALPDGRPVWGGTYFRKNEWINTLEQLQELHLSNPEKLTEYASKLDEALQAISKPVLPQNDIKSVEGFQFNPTFLNGLVSKWSKSFDHDFGGMARAPKFMMPNNYQFLLRYAYQNNDNPLLSFVNLTLTKMAYGGLFDTVGGGFSRYSVDMKWHVPHFEKMLYDNGQLISLYSDAYRLTKNPLYQEIIEKTLGFCITELQSPDGGFYCALDADSLNEHSKSEEGAYYAWTEQQLREIIDEEYQLFSEVFSINDFGHWEHGNYVLIQEFPLEDIAAKHQILLSELQQKKKHWEQVLFTERMQRSKPGLDDKCLTSWNAIMLIGFADAYKAFQNQSYLDTALKNARFITEKLWHNGENLYRNYKDGKATINAYLEDYAFVIKAWLKLYEVTFDEKWLQEAKQLTDYCFEHFYDHTTGFFAFTSSLDHALIARHFETEDNVIPASNSVMAHNLYALSIYFGNTYYESVMENMLSKITASVDYPSAFSNWLDLYLNFSGQNRELAITGPHSISFGNNINTLYLPHVLLAGTGSESVLPFLQQRFTKDKNLFYVCKNKSCDLPSDDFDSVKNSLKIS
ncbi:thioredoxin domain-containing protein [Flavobacterium pallidum]|uniref:Thioredoxin domain-containing protein n=1 Tax=Flavobacterium pallidum TaxID=2172098 RepID=A0A2S1SEF7_9FLAO|nr:thioredoxin domain-containing protein [Flavobacterium pallidum]AWI24737.1 thioredoxin domain-containing protein [Flavobacterium pallidum]